jgi:hypothetical protein
MKFGICIKGISQNFKKGAGKFRKCLRMLVLILGEQTGWTFQEIKNLGEMPWRLLFLRAFRAMVCQRLSLKESLCCASGMKKV